MLKTLAALERLFDLIAVLIVVALMFIVATDVAMRYFFNSPFAWAYDLISMYLMVALFYLVLSSTFADGGHIAVDLFSRHMPPSLRRICEVVICGSALLVFVVIAYEGGVRAWHALRSSDVVAGYIAWPMWPSIAVVSLGVGLLSLRLLLHVLAYAVALVSKRDLIPLAHSAEESVGDTRSETP